MKVTAWGLFKASFKLYRWYKGGKWIKVIGVTRKEQDGYWVQREPDAFELHFKQVLKTEHYGNKG
jgi:DMSO/TMAO reductase YedYZ molybdopterin-dependent catalytic subunit